MNSTAFQSLLTQPNNHLTPNVVRSESGLSRAAPRCGSLAWNLDHSRQDNNAKVKTGLMSRNKTEKANAAESGHSHAEQGVQPSTDPAPLPASSPLAPQHPRLRLHPQFKSSHLPDPRDIILYLPPCYEQNPNRHYPVLFLQDGQNLFDGRTSFVPGRTWQVHEHADAAIEAGEVEPLIIVGIYNTGTRRLAEYTPEPDPKLAGGEAVEYGLMLTEDLMPWLAHHYRILTDREHTGIGGSSLGALLSLFLGLHMPTRFGKLAVFSPSVWWNKKSILSHLNEHAPQIWDRPRLWLDIGDHEGYKALHDAEQLARRLRANGWKQGSTLHFERIHGGTHDEASWAQRVRPMLRFLFPAERHGQ
jgi:predicted alpha/beta superfamily hydrolase